MSSSRGPKRGAKSDLSAGDFSKPLDELVAELKEDFREVAPREFAALLDGEPVWITAVLERTAVYWKRSPTEKQLARLDRYLVDLAIVPIVQLPARLVSAANGVQRAADTAPARKGTPRAGGRRPNSYSRTARGS